MNVKTKKVVALIVAVVLAFAMIVPVVLSALL